MKLRRIGLWDIGMALLFNCCINLVWRKVMHKIAKLFMNIMPYGKTVLSLNLNWSTARSFPIYLYRPFAFMGQVNQVNAFSWFTLYNNIRWLKLYLCLSSLSLIISPDHIRTRAALWCIDKLKRTPLMVTDLQFGSTARQFSSIFLLLFAFINMWSYFMDI